jgi:hypothetical protein
MKPRFEISTFWMLVITQFAISFIAVFQMMQTESMSVWMSPVDILGVMWRWAWMNPVLSIISWILTAIIIVQLLGDEF